MSVRITWAPSLNSNIASYDVETALAVGGPYSLLVNVPHVIPGANYDGVTGKFFYVDTGGALTTWYRLISIDTLANRSAPSAPIEPMSEVPSFSNTVKVDHNYGFAGSLRYQTAGGIPVEAAVIRIWKKADFDAGQTDAPLAITMTNAQGNWITPVNLTTGFTYVVQYAKEGLYGPDKTEIVV